MDDTEGAEPSDEWPSPPAWMFDCGVCFRLYQAMRRAPEAVEGMRTPAGAETGTETETGTRVGAETSGDAAPGGDPSGSGGLAQLRLARHIVRRHERSVPGPEAGCPRCADDAGNRRAPSQPVLEHRARHLIVPASVASAV
jgi:hypothetical protein